MPTKGVNNSAGSVQGYTQNTPVENKENENPVKAGRRKVTKAQGQPTVSSAKPTQTKTLPMPFTNFATSQECRKSYMKNGSVDRAGVSTILSQMKANRDAYKGTSDLVGVDRQIRFHEKLLEQNGGTRKVTSQSAAVDENQWVDASLLEGRSEFTSFSSLAECRGHYTKGSGEIDSKAVSAIRRQLSGQRAQLNQDASAGEMRNQLKEQIDLHQAILDDLANKS